MDKEPAKREPEEDNGGAWVTLGKQQLKVPPLNFKSLQDLEETLTKISTITGRPSKEQIGLVLEVAFHAVRRNYTSMTQEMLAEMVDMGNSRTLLSTIMNVPGTKETPSGE